MGNQTSQQEQKPKDDSHLYEYQKVGSIMLRVDKTQVSSFQDQSHKNQQNQEQPNKSQKSSGPFRNLSDGKQNRDLLEESEPKKPSNKLHIIQEETSSNRYQSSLTPIYTEVHGQGKYVRVYVDKDIEFNLEISNDQLTCGWMLTEVTKRYTDELNRIKKEKELQMSQIIASHSAHSGVIQHSPNHKYTRKMIVTLKTTDQRESLDYWLTQYDRPLDVLEDGDFLIAHFVKLAANKRKEICKKDFEQIKVIGRGGFSRVILVRKKDTGRLYAMKIMKKNKILREKKLKPILSERKILEKLKHPFIIKLHWAFQSNEELFFVMDLCTGGEIFFHLNRLKRFSDIQAKFLFSEILLGIEYLHNKNVVYRDIKPENILIDIDGHIRIADFGLSKLIPQRQKSYSFCGSPEYMSPEMLQVAGHDRRVDIYCLGALLFEMLTGLPPFYNKDTNKMYENILTHELVFPDYINPQIQNLIQGMMQKDPNMRFQSISEVKRHQWLKDVPWDEILHKRISPPIVPSVRDCHIDPDYIELPLDFEESQYKVRLSTERRYSYYYESTLQSKSATEQSFYNNFFEKNESGSGVVNLLGGQGSSVKSGVFNGSTNPYGASVQSEQSQQSHDSNQLNNNRQQTKNPITGLENFTFIDTPFDEIDVLRQLKKYSNQFEDKKQEDPARSQFKPFSMLNLNQISPSDINTKLFNKKILPHHSINDNRLEDLKYQNTFTYPLEESNKGNFTLSNKSGLTFEESNQSIAQEYKNNESIATVFGPGGNIIGTSILQPSGSGIINFKQTSILMTTNNRLTIQEEEDDDLQSVGGSNYKNPNNANEQERDKMENFSFKQQSSENLILTNFAPSSYLNENFQSKTKSQNSNLNLCGNNYTAQMSSVVGVGQTTMTTATQSSQYNNTHHNFIGATDITTSQYTEETPIGTGRGCHTSSNSKNAFQIPQFGRSGSQTNNIAKQPLQNPLFVHNSSVKNPGINPQSNLHSHVNDQSILEKEIEDQRAHLVLTPNYNKKNKKPEKKTDLKEETNRNPSTHNLKIYNDGSTQKKSTTRKATGNFNTEEKHLVYDEHEISFARIPSISGQHWPTNTGGRESANIKQKDSDVIQDGQSQAVKKSMHKHKPSYSLSPSNIIATSTALQQQQQKQQKIQQVNMKQAAQAMKKQAPQTAVKIPQSSLNKHLNIVKKPATASNNNNHNTQPSQSSTSGIKSFLKAALPLAMQGDNYKTPEGTSNPMITGDESSDPNKYNNQLSSGKKNPQQQRSQKFRSMDMTQNLLKKSMGTKGAALKNNVAWKQHLLQIQTSQSPIKEQTGMSQNGGFNQNSQITNSYCGAISIVDQAKQPGIQGGNQILEASPVNLNQSHLTIQNEIGVPAKFVQVKKDPHLIASKTPERKDSDTSMDSKSTVVYGGMPLRANQLPIADKKRRSDGSQQSICSVNQIQGKDSTAQSQTATQPYNGIKANIFSTPKGSKAPINSTITPTNQGGYNSQRTVGLNVKPAVKKGTTLNTNTQIKTAGNGLSRNDLNQKKSNTAQAVVSKKIKNM